MDALMAVGGFIPLSYVFYGVIQNARQRRQLNWLGLFLAFFGVLLPVGLITWGVLTGQSEVFLTLAALSSAGVMILFGLIAVTQDARNNQPLNRSNGLMGAGAGLLILVAVLVITQVLPLTGISTSTATAAMPGNFPAMQQQAGSTAGGNTTSAESSAPAAAASDTAGTAATLETELPSMPSGFALPALDTATVSDIGAVSAETPEPSEVSASSGSAAAPEGFAVPVVNTAVPGAATAASSGTEAAANVLTLDQFVSDVLTGIGEIEVTPVSATTADDAAVAETTVATSGTSASASNSETAVAASTCQAVVRNNLNLRAEPNADSERLTTIPYSTLVTAAAISDDNWWQVTYDGLTGWVSGEYLDAVGECS